jgi:RNA polymerase sigma-70 factor, ECF subfamily
MNQLSAPRESAETMELRRNQDTLRPRVDRDRQLVDALRRGEATAVEDLVATYGDRAYRLAVRITLSEQDAEEVVQDAFWTVVHKIDSFRGEAAFASWFYRIVANAAYQKLRGRWHRASEVSLDQLEPHFDDRDSAADWSARIDDPSLQAELRVVLTAAIDELPPAYRTALILRDVEGFAAPEIGRALDMSVSCVKTRVHRARLFLRKRLASYMASAPGATNFDKVA